VTTQEAYEKMRAWFTQPGARLAMKPDPTGGCLYHGDQAGSEYPELAGTKCAVGCLIPDALYTPTLEVVGSLAEWEAVMTEDHYYHRAEEINAVGAVWNALGMDDHDKFQFLLAAQQAHDSSDDASMFVSRLDEIAASNNLAVLS
jgi:hypothetical protein